MRGRLGGLLTGIGGALGMFGVIAMVIRLKVTLTPQMQEVLFYKGLFAASLSLIVIGAIIGRRMRSERPETERGLAQGYYDERVNVESPVLREPEPRLDDRVSQTKGKKPVS